MATLLYDLCRFAIYMIALFFGFLAFVDENISGLIFAGLLALPIILLPEKISKR